MKCRSQNGGPIKNRGRLENAGPCRAKDEWDSRSRMVATRHTVSTGCGTALLRVKLTYRFHSWSILTRPSISTGWPKNWHNVLYALTLSNINRFSQFFHCQNQEKSYNNTITKDSTKPQLCRYTTLCPIKAPRRGVLLQGQELLLKHFTYLYIWYKNCRMWQLL